MLAAFDGPVVFVTGDVDVAPGPKSSARQTGLARHGRLHVILDCGHYVPLERPEALNDILREVIAAAMREPLPIPPHNGGGLTWGNVLPTSTMLHAEVPHEDRAVRHVKPSPCGEGLGGVLRPQSRLGMFTAFWLAGRSSQRFT